MYFIYDKSMVRHGMPWNAIVRRKRDTGHVMQDTKRMSCTFTLHIYTYIHIYRWHMQLSARRADSMSAARLMPDPRERKSRRRCAECTGRMLYEIYLYIYIYIYIYPCLLKPIPIPEVSPVCLAFLGRLHSAVLDIFLGKHLERWALPGNWWLWMGGM